MKLKNWNGIVHDFKIAIKENCCFLITNSFNRIKILSGKYIKDLEISPIAEFYEQPNVTEVIKKALYSLRYLEKLLMTAKYQKLCFSAGENLWIPQDIKITIINPDIDNVDFVYIQKKEDLPSRILVRLDLISESIYFYEYLKFILDYGDSFESIKNILQGLRDRFKNVRLTKNPKFKICKDLLECNSKEEMNLYLELIK